MVTNSIEIQSSLDPYPVYAEMRKSRSVNFNEMVHMWEVFRYNDVQRVLMEYTTFSSHYMGGGPFSESLVSIDPPKHRQLRNLVTQAFTPRTIAQLAPRVREIVHELLQAVVATGEM